MDAPVVGTLAWFLSMVSEVASRVVEWMTTTLGFFTSNPWTLVFGLLVPLVGYIFVFLTRAIKN